MSVYTFGAEPRVVKGKAKFRGGDEEAVVKAKTPIEMAEEAIKFERDSKKIDLLKDQLIQFKKNKTKQTPYDLRPAPPPKIEVDLTYFLTEQNVIRPAIEAQDMQTDETLPGPPEPPYLPQKKGIDCCTQIWDNDLFDYDVEVEPILSVLVSKTLEQSKLEVDEAAEIEAIKKYKEEFKERRKIEKEGWEEQVKEELKRLAKKNELLQREREKHERREVAIKKLQCIHISKAYLSHTLHNSMESVIGSGYWPKEEFEIIHGSCIQNIVGKISKEVVKKDEIQASIRSIMKMALLEPTKLAQPIKDQLKVKQALKQRPKKIEDPRFRNIRVMFSNLTKPKMTKLGFYIRKALLGKLEEWEKETKESFQKLHGTSSIICYR